jgi:hypothetical protein
MLKQVKQIATKDGLLVKLEIGECKLCKPTIPETTWAGGTQFTTPTDYFTLLVM